MWLDSSCKYTKNNANHNEMGFDPAAEYGWIPLANILKIMRITTEALLNTLNNRLDSSCKYTKNNANHNRGLFLAF